MRASAAIAQPEPLLRGRLLLFVLATLAAVAGSRWLPASEPATMLAVAAIAVAVWHGAFDNVLAEEAFGTSGARARPHWQALFYVAYLAAAGAVLLLWWVAPGVALVAFLLYSALHFGTEGEQRLGLVRLGAGLAAGFVPIAAACHWWPEAVDGIFRLMLRGDSAASSGITRWAGAALWPVAAIALLAAWLNRGEALSGTLVLATELALFRFCSPVTAFAVFFCLWHTPEHMVSTSLGRAGQFRPGLLLSHLRRGMVPWLAALASVALGCWLGRHTAQAYVGTLFIVLSALTVPHMVLAEFYRRRQEVRAKQQGLRVATQHAAVRG